MGCLRRIVGVSAARSVAQQTEILFCRDRHQTVKAVGDEWRRAVEATGQQWVPPGPSSGNAKTGSSWSSASVESRNPRSRCMRGCRERSRVLGEGLYREATVAMGWVFCMARIARSSLSRLGPRTAMNASIASAGTGSPGGMLRCSRRGLT